MRRVLYPTLVVLLGTGAFLALVTYYPQRREPSPPSRFYCPPGTLPSGVEEGGRLYILCKPFPR